LTCLGQLDGFEVCCDHVNRGQQGLRNFGNSQLSSKELLLGELQSNMSTNGRDGIQDPVSGKNNDINIFSTARCFYFNVSSLNDSYL